MPWLLALQSLVTLGLAVSCWRYARRAGADYASVWQAIAELRMHHNALEGAASDAFEAIDDRFAELELDPITVAPPPKCQCPNCRKRRAQAVN